MTLFGRLHYLVAALAAGIATTAGAVLAGLPIGAAQGLGTIAAVAVVLFGQRGVERISRWIERRWFL
ncbi:MAG: hypothetical protein HY459_01800 [Parcubacteria group bacterium]|nr:hypothetical protein [Parcubacteria group bacterium]